MLSTGGFDVMLQFKQDVMNDILIRVLNESLLTNLHLKSPISRLIEQPIPTAEVKAYWDKPDLALSDDNSISLSVEVNGGARQLITQRILTISGSISITRKALLVEANDGTFYLGLESPQPLDLHMSKLHATYAGSRWPEFLSAIDPTREISALRPVLTYELMYPLANLPLSYDVRSLPLRFSPSNSFRPTSPLDWIIPVRATDIHLVKTTETEVVAICVSLTNVSCDASRISGTFPKGVESNASITLTSSGMNFVLERLGRQDALAGIIQSTSKAQEVSWRWESLTVAFHNDYISLAGNLRMNATVTHVAADLYCFVDQYGYLTITPRAITTDASIAETIIASWSTVLRMILRARDKNQRDDDGNDQYKLFQCFVIPGTQVAVEAVANTLLIEEGALTLFYDIPKESEGFHAEIPLHKPKVTITQPHIPVQMAKGAPVSIEMQAQLTAQSYPPYDYVWTTDLSQGPTPDRGQSMTVTGLPTTTVTDNELQVLTNTHVKVIDMFGQDVDASAPALYQPWSHKQQSPSRDRSLDNVDSTPVVHAAVAPPPQHRRPSRGWTKGVGCLGIIAIIAIIVISLFRYIPVGAQPPQLTVSPGSLNTNSCVHSNSGNWTCTVTVGESSSSQVDLTWSVSSDVGASFSPQSTTLSPGTSVPVSIFNLPCQNGNLTFTGSGGAQPVKLSWSCAPPPPMSVEVTPTSFNQTNCPQNSNRGWTCTATVTEISGSQGVTWSEISSFSDVTFNPGSGTVSVGNPASVSISIPANDCQNGTFTFNFTGGVNPIPVSWSCTPVLTLTVSPPSINGNTDCSYGANNGWTCSATLNSSPNNQGNLNWSASSSGLSGISFSQANGTLSPGQSQPVEIFVSAVTICPVTANLIFSGPANTVTVPWSCAAPTLKVSPTSLGPPSCQSVQGTWTCIVTLSDDQGGANWSASAKGVTFTPPSGTVYPSGQTVTISVGCTSNTFSFQGPANTVTVSWQCIG